MLQVLLEGLHLGAGGGHRLLGAQVSRRLLDTQIWAVGSSDVLG